MHILIVYPGIIPVTLYGGTERVIWYLGKELLQLGHKVTYLARKGSSCSFAPVIAFDPAKAISYQIPEDVDVVHFNFSPGDLSRMTKPYVITMHGNTNDQSMFDRNTIFISKNHADRFGSEVFVHNGLDWSDYLKPDFFVDRQRFHFLGNAAWRVKNVRGAIDVITRTKNEKLDVLGGVRFNVKMGLRFTFSPRVRFYGMVGGEQKFELLNRSKGLIFPVRWHEPFGLAIIESLYFGCPVFGTPYGSLPEIVSAEVGYLSNNATKLLEAIESSAAFSSKKCHEYAVEMFNSKKMALSYLENYEKVLAGEMLNEYPPSLKEVQTVKFLDWVK
ncbi:glycosyltransferase [Desertivirga xinjiangensis]|uniref:glycosyltransferase n=1 Tax=Desertivirga xinjiangensis TaxID=539206 RepID=UPI0021090DE1|nr:glycosyltransferase [Pedobacter xinjiangensis]